MCTVHFCIVGLLEVNLMQAGREGRGNITLKFCFIIPFENSPGNIEGNFARPKRSLSMLKVWNKLKNNM